MLLDLVILGMCRFTFKVSISSLTDTTSIGLALIGDTDSALQNVVIKMRTPLQTFPIK